MKRKIIFWVVVIVLIALLISLYQPIRGEIYWHMFTNNTINSYESYLNKFPNGKHRTQAKFAIDTLQWNKAKEENTVRSYQEYIDAHPEGHFLRIAYENFIKKHPGQILEEKAKNILKDMDDRDILDLIKENKIELNTFGSGQIDNIQLKLLSLVNHGLHIIIPAGTFFECNGNAQNMVSTTQMNISLKSNESKIVKVPTACANLHKDIPTDKEKFSIQRSSNQKELQKLMLVLNNASIDKYVKQAATWIVTDNADYNDLGRLIGTREGVYYQVGGGFRVITVNKTVEAIKLCSDAGIDIKKKAIWGDCDLLYLGLDKNDSLKNWFETLNPLLVQRVKEILDKISEKFRKLDSEKLEKLNAKSLKIDITVNRSANNLFINGFAKYLQKQGHYIDVGINEGLGGNIEVVYKKGFKDEAGILSKILQQFFDKVKTYQMSDVYNRNEDIFITF